MQTLSRRFFLKKISLLTGVLLSGCNASTIKSTSDASLPTPSTTPPPRATDPEIEIIVLATGLDFPEGPAFDPKGRLWCTELSGGNIVLIDDGNLIRYPVGGDKGGRGNGMIFDRQGRAWVSDSGRNMVQRFDPSSEKWEVILDKVDGKLLQSPNDLCFDDHGNLIVTCPNFSNHEPTGYVICLSPDGHSTQIIEGFYRPNGIAIVDGGNSLIVADTYRKTLYKGTWNPEKRTWQDSHPWVTVGGSEGPDGMAVGANGLVYQAIYGDGVIKIINPEGEIQSEIRVPGQNPTNVNIDPSGKMGIVVTETEKGQILSIPSIQPGIAAFDGGEFWQ